MLPAAASARRFRASYHARALPPTRDNAGRKAERWAWFRIAVLEACQRLPRTSAELRVLVDLDDHSSPQRTALANQRRLVLGGFLSRGVEGYRTTPRGVRVIEDLRALGAG